MEVEIRFAPSGARIRVARGTSLLDAARRAGLPVASACGGDGLCGRCGLEVLAGAGALPEEGVDETRVKRRNRVDPALRLACRVAPRGDVEVRARYW